MSICLYLICDTGRTLIGVRSSGRSPRSSRVLGTNLRSDEYQGAPEADAPEAVWDGGANIPGGSPSRGSDVMIKKTFGRGGQTKNLHHQQSYTLHSGPAERFSKWSINDQAERKLALGPGHEPRQGTRGWAPGSSGVLGIYLRLNGHPGARLRALGGVQGAESKEAQGF